MIMLHILYILCYIFRSTPARIGIIQYGCCHRVEHVTNNKSVPSTGFDRAANRPLFGEGPVGRNAQEMPTLLNALHLFKTHIYCFVLYEHKD